MGIPINEVDRNGDYTLCEAKQRKGFGPGRQVMGKKSKQSCLLRLLGRGRSLASPWIELLRVLPFPVKRETS